MKNISFKVDLDNNTLDNYDIILSLFKDWKSYKREIKINSILNDKKIEFILDIRSHTIGVMYIPLLSEFDDKSILKNACCSIKKFKFIIKNNVIISLDIEVTLLETQYGNILKNILEYIDIVEENIYLKQYIDINNNVMLFYISNDFKNVS